MSPWASALPAVLVAAALLIAPGLIATAAWRMGLMARAAVAAALSVACIGIAGIVAGLLGIAFAPWQPVVPATLLGLALLWYRRRVGRPRVVREGVRRGWLIGAWAASAIVIAVVAFAAVPDPERISQTYDNVFHLSAIADILRTGDASSLTLRTLIETDRTWAYYPSAWHSLVALTVEITGASIPVAVNASWVAVCAVVWLPGVAWLAQTLLRAVEPGRVALVALPLGAGFGAMPFGLLTWGTLYPTFFGTALLPAAIAIPLASWPGRRRSPSDRPAYPLVLGASALVLALAALGFSQPRVLVTWAVILAPFAVAEAVRAFRWAVAAGGRLRRRAWGWLIGLVLAGALFGVGAFVYLVVRLGLFDRSLDERLGGPQARATQSVLDGLLQVLGQAWPTGVGAVVTAPALLLALAVAGGLVLAARTRGLRWVVVGYAALAVLFALAAGADDVFAKLATALWYKDRYRLDAALPVLGVPLAALGVLWAADRLARGRMRVGAVLGVVGAWLTASTAALALAVGGVGASTAVVFRLPDRGAQGEVVSRAQIDFFRDVVPARVPAGQRLLGDPWDGSALSQVYAGREPVFPHVNGQWDPERLLLAYALTDIDTDPAVCAALDALRVRYVVYDPHAFGGGDPSGNHFPAVHAAVEAGLFTPIATDGDTSLYRIDQCGPLPG